VSIWRFADWLHPCDPSSRITFGEGNTPLVRSRHIGPEIGVQHLYFKLESLNPTGSYKDRFGAAAISDMLARNKRRCVATTSGNTGSALAAAAAAANIACEIAVVSTAPQGKLRQMLAYGAKLYTVEGFGIDPDVTRDTFETVKNLGDAPDAQLQVSAYCYSPVGMTGVQTIGYELAEQSRDIGRPIDHVYASAGGGGLTLATARGLAKAAVEGVIETSPAVHCVQPEGNNTIAGPLRDGKDLAQSVDCTTDVSGLQVPAVMDGNEVIPACRASGGTGVLVRDDDVWQVQSRMAKEEGIFCEPAGAVPLTGALLAIREGQVEKDSVIVCLVTGTGFKDEVSLGRMVENAPCPTITLDELRAKLSPNDAKNSGIN
jgi:threonine synthase